MRLLRPLPAVVALLALALPATGRAQAPTGQVLPDSVEERLVVVLLDLRDSTSAVRGQLAVFRRDLSQAGAATVVGRATSLHVRCANASDALRQAEEQVRPGPGWPAVARAASADLIGAMRTLRDLVRTHCDVGLAPEGPGVRADTLRAWGPYRTGMLVRGITEFDRAVGRFARATSLHLEARIR
jgi:hypothetical protein